MTQVSSSDRKAIGSYSVVPIRRTVFGKMPEPVAFIALCGFTMTAKPSFSGRRTSPPTVLQGHVGGRV